jgi:UDP-N-acetylmuramoyl-L-alanyl-D-glutamate--2,6-diaminopimelate ligase
MPGSVFFAVPGSQADGLAFIPQALSRGALAVVAQSVPDSDIAGAAFILVDDVRAILAKAAAQEFPRQPETIVAITGTSGKTSIAAFTRQIWKHLGKDAASLGTIGLVRPSGSVSGSLTTPDPVSLHQTLDQIAGEGVTHLALEASSHGLGQKRLDGVRLSAGAFTNLSRDHLDYHASLEDYLKAKMRLFEDLLVPGQAAVIDADSEVADKVLSLCAARGLKLFSIGFKGRSIRLLETETKDLTSDIKIGFEAEVFDLTLPLLGAFQISNALVAAGLCIVTGSEPRQVFAALEALQGAPGRLELMGRRNGASVFVDYAHKPDALEKVLETLRPFVLGQLIVIFGCGGNRDQGKRPIMGEIAARLADVCIVTDDNPRFEDAGLIRAAIMGGAPGAKNMQEIGERGEAVNYGINLLQPGDILLIAGKGHETGQIIGDRVLEFSDRDYVLAVLKDDA